MQLQLKVIGMLDDKGFIVDNYAPWLIVDIDPPYILCAMCGQGYQRSKDGLIDWLGNELELGSKSYARLMEALQPKEKQANA